MYDRAYFITNESLKKCNALNNSAVSFCLSITMYVALFYLRINLYAKLNLKPRHFIDIVNCKLSFQRFVHALFIYFFHKLFLVENRIFTFIDNVFLHEGIQMHRSRSVSSHYSSWSSQIYHSDCDYANKDCRHRTDHCSVN